MASISATHRTAVITLAAATVDTVTLSAAARNIEVKNWGTVNRLSFRIDGTSPTADGAECFHVGPGEALIVSAPYTTDTVKLISTSGTTYSVTGIQ